MGTNDAITNLPMLHDRKKKILAHGPLSGNTLESLSSAIMTLYLFLEHEVSVLIWAFHLFQCGWKCRTIILMFIGDHILLLAGAGCSNAADSLLQSLIKIYLLLADDGAALKQRSITGWRYHRSHVGWRCNASLQRCYHTLCYITLMIVIIEAVYSRDMKNEGKKSAGCQKTGCNTLHVVFHESTPHTHVDNVRVNLV